MTSANQFPGRYDLPSIRVSSSVNAGLLSRTGGGPVPVIERGRCRDLTGIFNKLRANHRGQRFLFARSAWGHFRRINQSERAVSRPPAFTSLRVQACKQARGGFSVSFVGLSLTVFHDRNIDRERSQNEEFAVGEIRNV